MNRTSQFIFILVSATVGASSFAQEATSDSWMNVASSHSRDIVRQELMLAHPTSEAYDFSKSTGTASAKTREQVRVELNAAKASGEHAALNAEARGFQPSRQQLFAGVK